MRHNWSEEVSLVIGYVAFLILFAAVVLVSRGCGR